MGRQRAQPDPSFDQLSQDLAATVTRLVRWLPTKGFTLSMAAARLLGRLADRGATPVSVLASLEHSAQPTITNHVKRLEVGGLVRRSADPRDARVSLIELTDKGREQLSTLRHLHGVNVAPYLAQLTTAELKALGHGISAMERLMTLEPAE